MPHKILRETDEFLYVIAHKQIVIEPFEDWQRFWREQMMPKLFMHDPADVFTLRIYANSRKCHLYYQKKIPLNAKNKKLLELSKARAAGLFWPRDPIASKSKVTYTPKTKITNEERKGKYFYKGFGTNNYEFRKPELLKKQAMQKETIKKITGETGVGENTPSDTITKRVDPTMKVEDTNPLVSAPTPAPIPKKKDEEVDVDDILKSLEDDE